MISTLYPLQQIVGKIQTASSEASWLPAVAEEVVNICKAIPELSVSVYRQYQRLDLAKADFRRYHRKLIDLTYQVQHLHLKHENKHISLIYKELKYLLKEQEYVYYDLIDPLAPLPDDERENLFRQVDIALSTIKTKLSEKGIHQKYLAEIVFAMDSLFDSNKLPQVSYHHRYYLPQLLNALEALAIDTRQKRWQQRFMQIMINYNFNYMGLFNRWCEQQDHLLAEAIRNEESGAYFRNNKNTLRHYHPLSSMAYDPQNSSLLQHMNQYLAGQKQDHKQAQREAEIARPSALHTSLSSLEMTIDFHYKYKFNYYPHPTKREAAKAYAQAHRSKTGQYISAHTLEKLDKKELEAAATKMRSKLLKIAQQIKEDFNL